MCIEYNLLKGIVQYLPFVLFTFGIASLAGSYVVAGIFMDQVISLDYLYDVNSMEGLIVTLNILSSFLISAGLCGIVGNQKRIPPLSICYNIGNMLMIIGFLVLTILSFTFQNSASWNNIFEQSNCNNQNLLYDSNQLNNYYKQAEALLCKNTTQDSVGCLCYYYISTSVNPSIIQNYTSSQSSKNRSSTSINYQECKGSNNSIPSNVISFLEQTEKNYYCSGWCSYYPLYIFSNVNYGTPKKSCYSVISQQNTSVTKIIAIVSITVFSVLIVILTFVLLLCCHPNKRVQTNLIFRMNHYD